MARKTIQPRYYEVLKQRFGTHKAVAKRLGISRDYYQRIRNDPENHQPSTALYNAIITLVHTINLENELVLRS